MECSEINGRDAAIADELIKAIGIAKQLHLENLKDVFAWASKRLGEYEAYRRMSAQPEMITSMLRGAISAQREFHKKNEEAKAKDETKRKERSERSKKESALRREKKKEVQVSIDNPAETNRPYELCGGDEDSDISFSDEVEVSVRQFRDSAHARGIKMASHGYPPWWYPKPVYFDPVSVVLREHSYDYDGRGAIFPDCLRAGIREPFRPTEHGDFKICATH